MFSWWLLRFLTLSGGAGLGTDTGYFTMPVLTSEEVCTDVCEALVHGQLFRYKYNYANSTQTRYRIVGKFGGCKFLYKWP